MEDFNNLNSENVSEQTKSVDVFGFTFNRMTSDMKFLGMFYIIYGVLASLSIIGAIIGIPLLISGLRLRESANELNSYRGTNDAHYLRRGFELQGKFFNIQKIIILVGIVITVLYIIGIVLVQRELEFLLKTLWEKRDKFSQHFSPYIALI
ncbi:MAG: DUF5362 domain-containing protein [Melioribacteraceae bacterium]|jgi:hypothetical protein|nr:DUF5362 domain-containing protein [Melioribacteraceae bacterium]